ncbi:MAG TPA: HPr family phosphocarrier protein [Kiloniellales bacterium]|nr:HPr family phosphocarrier protein [Kiloniellales bacterium]
MTTHLPPSEEAEQPCAVRRVLVCNRRGLHARAAAKFVKLAGEFTAAVTVVRRDQQVPGGSIMGLMMLAAGPGCEIELRAEGPQAEAALDALAALVQRRFDED